MDTDAGPEDQTGSTASRWHVVVLVLIGAAAGALVTWAALSLMVPPADPLEATDHTYVAVTQGEVGSSIALNAVAEWVPVPVGANLATGIVTQVSITAGDEVGQGSVLYRVNERPVTVAQGDVPMFRSIGPGAEGADVQQLQVMLTAVGFYGGNADGRAGAGTLSAVKAWQKSLGIAQTGTVEIGDIVFVPSLPTRVSIDEKIIFRGNPLAGGEQVVRGLPPAPKFSMPVTESQSAMMPIGTRVEVTSPEGATWEGFVADRVRDEQSGNVTIQLQGRDGAALCGDQCAQVPVTGQTTLASRVVTVETVAGLVVPSAALVTGATGEVEVVDEAGDRLPVTVLTAARGMSVIEGVDEGTRVRVPANGAP